MFECRKRRYSKAVILLLLFALQVNAVFKITNVQCLAEDKSFGNFSVCRLKAVKRDVTEFTAYFDMNRKADNVLLNIEILRKYNGYKPFLFNVTADACLFLKQPKSFKLFGIVYDLLKDYSNINHTCPYEGTVFLNKFTLQHKNLLLPLPTGEYLFKSTWIVDKIVVGRVNVWFTLKELEQWEKDKL